MGWMFMNRPKGYSDRKWIERQFGPDFSKKVVAVASSFGIMHVVIEVRAQEEPSLVPDENGNVRLCLIILTRWVKDDYYNWGYKDMSEFSGPVQTKCPLKLLDMLSPFNPDAIATAEAKRTGGERYHPTLSARDWRDACRKLAESRKALAVGVTYKLPQMIRWSDGAESDTLTLIERKGQRIVFRRADNCRVRLSRDLIGSLEAV